MDWMVSLIEIWVEGGGGVVFVKRMENGSIEVIRTGRNIRLFFVYLNLPPSFQFLFRLRRNKIMKYR